jgi:hypothetical protein
MYRVIAVLLLLVGSVASASAQGLVPSAWKSQGGAILKILNVEPANGNFSGIFISSPTGPCPGVPYDLVGKAQGHLVQFQTSRRWTTDCGVTASWSGRVVSPTTVTTRWNATVVAPDGRVSRRRGTEFFQRM